MTNKKLLLIMFTIICLVGFIYSSYQILMWNFNVDENAKINDKLDDKIKVNKKDKILTLSSCIGDGEERVVLHSKLIENN